MFHFEIELAKFLKEMNAEREATAAKKAEQERLNIGEKFMRNDSETKAQTVNHGKRGGSSRD